MSLIAAFLISLMIGLSFAWVVCPRTGAGLADLPLALSVGIASGLGLTSVLLFLLLAVGDGSGRAEPVSAAVLATILAGAAAVHKPFGRRAPKPSPAVFPRMRWLTAAFCLAALAAAAGLVLLCLHSPHGQFDAWANWNRQARFMFRGGEHWKDVFSPDEAGWAPTHPMLTAGAIAHCWFFVGRETLLAPTAVAFLFCVAVVGLLVSSLSLLRSPRQGLIAGIVLLCSPPFVVQAASQYADVPLASFYLGAVLFLCLHDTVQRHRGWLVMSGMMAGMAAWTKPEGLMFVLVVVLVRCVLVGASRGAKACARDLSALALGLLPVLTVRLYFEFHMVSATSDLVQGQTPQAFLTRLLTGHRYLIIVKAFGKQFVGLGGWVVTLPPLLLMYLLLVGINKAWKDRLAIYTASLTLMLMTCGYFMVYVFTPNDLVWQLGSSLDRLLMQLWPLAIFTFFLWARTPEEVAAEGANSQLAGRIAVDCRK